MPDLSSLYIRQQWNEDCTVFKNTEASWHEGEVPYTLIREDWMEANCPDEWHWDKASGKWQLRFVGVWVQLDLLQPDGMWKVTRSNA